MSDPDPTTLEIRAMRRAELDLAIDWAAQEGWNPGLADAACFHAADPDGFLMGFADGEPVGSISVVRYPGGFAFLGFYIVRPHLRGRGFGLRLWQAGLARLAGGTIGLDGVVAQQANYARSGFVLAHRNVRYGGTVTGASPSDARLRVIEGPLVDAVIAYDRALFPAPRERFLRCWLEPERRHGLALVETATVRGYGVIRACRDGHKIGPLFTETVADAEVLFGGLAATAAGAPVFLDVPEPNRAAVDLAKRHGLTPAFETARMYRGPAPALPLGHVFGITTFELG